MLNTILNGAQPCWPLWIVSVYIKKDLNEKSVSGKALKKPARQQQVYSVAGAGAKSVLYKGSERFSYSAECWKPTVNSDYCNSWWSWAGTNAWNWWWDCLSTFCSRHLNPRWTTAEWEEWSATLVALIAEEVQQEHSKEVEQSQKMCMLNPKSWWYKQTECLDENELWKKIIVEKLQWIR